MKARNAGYSITTHDIIFSERYSGKAKIGLVKAAYETGFAAIKLRLANPEVIPFHPNLAAEKGNGFHYKGAPFVTHTQLPHDETALYTTNSLQKKILFIFLLA